MDEITREKIYEMRRCLDKMWLIYFQLKNSPDWIELPPGDRAKIDLANGHRLNADNRLFEIYHRTAR